MVCVCMCKWKGEGGDKISGGCGVPSYGLGGEMWLDGDVYNVKRLWLCVLKGKCMCGVAFRLW